ncbi:MAG: adenylosuccinate lyase [Betaproteobacteria bacterium]|nr:MAG: adenylosuccinate lyase [Betaproteobacteria bacterium]
MASGIFDDALLKHIWTTDELRAVFDDRNRVQKWYDFEAALALEQAGLGIIPRAAGDEIASKARADDVDMEAIGAEIRRIKHPLVPALRALQERCSPALGEYVHFGPTTQDVLDTGTVLQLRDAHAIFLRDMKAIGEALYGLAEKHRATPMVGRTHGVQALPITFGHKCAVWLSEMGRHHQRMRELEPRLFVGGLVGAVGTKASYGPQANELDRRVMRRLGLGVADISWQAARDRFAEYACVLGMLGATLGKIANEILILQHNEIDELAEPFSAGKLGSSTMPHKRNPSTVEGASGVARALRYNVALMLECMIIEHERDAASWRAEWRALPETCQMAGALLASMRYVLSGLVVNAEKMRSNLDLLGGFLLSERVMFALAEKVGKQTAHELVYEASMRGIEQGITFEEALLRDERIGTALTRAELRASLDPTTYVGLAPQIVDDVLAQVRAAGWLN